MILLEDQPTLTDLHQLIREVRDYPINVRELIELAQRVDAPRTVIDFYRTFPEDEIFLDEDDLMATTDNVELLRHQEELSRQYADPEN